MFMRKSILLCFVFFFLASVFAVNVTIDAQVFKDRTQFTYHFFLEKNESYSFLSITKPKDARLISAYLGKTPLTTKVADNYYLVSLDNAVLTQDLIIRFESNDISQQLLSKQTFSNYVGFNVPVSKLDFTYTPREEFGTIQDVFPREYIVKGTALTWERTLVEKEEVFMVKYDETTFNTTLNNQTSQSNYNLIFIIAGVSLVFIVLIFILFYFFTWRKFLVLFGKKEKETKKEQDHNQEHHVSIHHVKELEPVIEVKVTTPSISVDNSPSTIDVKKDEKHPHDEIVQKYLTENEQDVVDLVRKKEGISQYDILNEIPTMSKSNLSKIISKLHARRFLQRIRVGKINKIHLGDKFQEVKDEQKKED